MPNPILHALPIVASACLLGCAGVLNPTPDNSKRTEQSATVLAGQSDADSLAVAGLKLTDRPELSLSLIDRAVAVAPERSDLVWLRIRICQQTPDCDPEPSERLLQTLDPANGAGWLGVLVRAERTQNVVAKQEALAAIGRSERFDVYWTTLVFHLSHALAATQAASLPEATTAVIGYVAAEAVPAYKPVSDACTGQMLQVADVAESCRSIARAFQHGDTYITEMVGVAIAERVWAEGSPEWKAAREARRAFEYRSKSLEDIDALGPEHVDEYLALCATNRREQEVFAAELIARGKDPNPRPE